MDSQLTALYASNNPLMYIGLENTLKSKLRFIKPSSTIEHGDDAILAIIKRQPNIAFLDFELRRTNAIEIAMFVSKYELTTHIVIFIHPEHMSSLSQEQVNNLNISVLSKHEDLQNVKECTDAIISKQKYISKALWFEPQNNKPKKNIENFYLKKLTSKELEVITLISEGKSTKDIANQLYLSSRTIDAHRMRIRKKLCLKGKNSLIHFAIEQKKTLVYDCNNKTL